MQAACRSIASQLELLIPGERFTQDFMSVNQEEITLSILNRRVERAASSLTRFSVTFDDGSGLILEATLREGAPDVAASLVPAIELPEDTDAVCRVDWKWIAGSRITAVERTAGAVQFALDPAGPLKVSAQLWQASPFLAFQPFRAGG